jgi:hypothetical protein
MKFRYFENDTERNILKIFFSVTYKTIYKAKSLLNTKQQETWGIAVRYLLFLYNNNINMNCFRKKYKINMEMYHYNLDHCI